MYKLPGNYRETKDYFTFFLLIHVKKNRGKMYTFIRIIFQKTGISWLEKKRKSQVCAAMKDEKAVFAPKGR